MHPKRNPKLMAIGKYLQEEFGLKYVEIDVLLNDTLVNLGALQIDVGDCLDSSNWPEVLLAARALKHLGKNIGNETVQKLGKVLLHAAETKNEVEATRAWRELGKHLDELIPIGDEIEGSQVDMDIPV